VAAAGTAVAAPAPPKAVGQQGQIGERWWWKVVAATAVAVGAGF